MFMLWMPSFSTSMLFRIRISSISSSIGLPKVSFKTIRDRKPPIPKTPDNNQKYIFALFTKAKIRGDISRPTVPTRLAQPNPIDLTLVGNSSAM